MWASQSRNGSFTLSVKAPSLSFPNGPDYTLCAFVGFKAKIWTGTALSL